MNTPFQNLEPEKQERIINAALKEFAQKGFENASTNEVAKAADISKGLLFHYFNSKKDLFLFLYDYSTQFLVDEFFGKVDWNEKDVFHRLQQMALLKMEIIRKHPDMYNFLLSANLEQSAEVKEDLEQRNKGLLSASYSKLMEGIDGSKFKEGLDVQKAVQIIFWTLEGFANQEIDKMKLSSSYTFNDEQILAEMNQYLDILKRSFYK